MKTKLIIPLLLLLSVGAAAQTTRKELNAKPERTGATYFAYPPTVKKAQTPSPEGYEPFYISHFGRHGSRYMTENDAYEFTIGQLDTAARLGILTPKGTQVLEQLRIAYADAWMRDGELTKLGAQQHREIARRMYWNYPTLLSQPLKVDARSSTANRCMISMFNFCNELQGLNPSLAIRMDASKRDMPFVVGDEHIHPEDGPAAADYERQLEALIIKAGNDKRFMKSLFTDVPRARTFIEGFDLMDAFFNIAMDMQNVPELGISFMDLFTAEERLNIYIATNAYIMAGLGLTPGSTPEYRRQLTARDSIQSIADRVIGTGKPAVTLRFSHDGSLIPLAYLMGLKETQGGRSKLDDLYKYLSIDKISPMAANIQLIFYRKEGSDDVLVKFLLNENETSIPIASDCAPYYHWSEVKAYWEGRK